MHIVDQLLEQGYRVRGTVRDAEKAVWTSKYFKDRYGVGRYTPVSIPDMARQDAFDIAVRGCSGVVHVASVTSMSPDPNGVITPSIAGALNALEAAAKESAVRRVVYCSSVAAAVSHDRGVRNEITSDSWNMCARSSSLCDAETYADHDQRVQAGLRRCLGASAVRTQQSDGRLREQ